MIQPAPAPIPRTPAQRYYDVLKHIAKDFMTADELRKNAEGRYGLPYAEALEMAYENMQRTAKEALQGRRRPR